VVVYQHGQNVFDSMARVSRMRWFQSAIETLDSNVGCIEWEDFLKSPAGKRFRKSAKK
jgi:hypothetical protein